VGGRWGGAYGTPCFVKPLLNARLGETATRGRAPLPARAPRGVGRKRGQFPALWISPGSALHAHVAGYGRGWPTNGGVEIRRQDTGYTRLTRKRLARRKWHSHTLASRYGEFMKLEIHSTAENPPPYTENPAGPFIRLMRMRATTRPLKSSAVGEPTGACGARARWGHSKPAGLQRGCGQCVCRRVAATASRR
jgi:hypothetical protein